MALDDSLMEHVDLFELTIMEGLLSSGEGYRFVEAAPDKYNLELSPSLRWEINNLNPNFARNVAIGILTYFGACFTEETKIGKDSQHGFYITGLTAIIDGSQTILAFADVNESAVNFYCPVGVKEFLQANRSWAFDGIMESTGKIVRSDRFRRSAEGLLSGTVEFSAVRATDYDSLANYLANNQGEIHVGDVIRNVEITSRVKKKHYGAFSIEGNEVRVPGSTPNDMYDVRISEQLTATMFRAEIVSS